MNTKYFKMVLFFLIFLMVFAGLNAFAYAFDNLWDELHSRTMNLAFLIVYWIQFPSWLIVCEEQMRWGKTPLPVFVYCIVSVLSALFYTVIVIPVFRLFLRVLRRRAGPAIVTV